jgi:hypothetical protein
MPVRRAATPAAAPGLPLADATEPTGAPSPAPQAAKRRRVAKKAPVADTALHMMKESKYENRAVTITTTCGRTGPPGNGRKGVGILTTVWPSDVTCPGCRSAPGVTRKPTAAEIKHAKPHDPACPCRTFDHGLVRG